jgi:hypothetical protein
MEVVEQMVLAHLGVWKSLERDPNEYWNDWNS